MTGTPRLIYERKCIHGYGRIPGWMEEMDEGILGAFGVHTCVHTRMAKWPIVMQHHLCDGVANAPVLQCLFKSAATATKVTTRFVHIHTLIPTYFLSFSYSNIAKPYPHYHSRIPRPSATSPPIHHPYCHHLLTPRVPCLWRS